jgi:hypothetical protein
MGNCNNNKIIVESDECILNKKVNHIINSKCECRKHFFNRIYNNKFSDLENINTVYDLIDIVKNKDMYMYSYVTIDNNVLLVSFSSLGRKYNSSKDDCYPFFWEGNYQKFYNTWFVCYVIDFVISESKLFNKEVNCQLYELKNAFKFTQIPCKLLNCLKQVIENEIATIDESLSIKNKLLNEDIEKLQNSVNEIVEINERIDIIKRINEFKNKEEEYKKSVFFLNENKKVLNDFLIKLGLKKVEDLSQIEYTEPSNKIPSCPPIAYLSTENDEELPICQVVQIIEERSENILPRSEIISTNLLV